MMKRIAQLTLMVVLLLAGVSLAVAQPALQPVNAVATLSKSAMMCGCT